MRSAVGIPVLPAQAVAKAKGGEDVNAASSKLSLANRRVARQVDRTAPLPHATPRAQAARKVSAEHGTLFRQFRRSLSCSQPTDDLDKRAGLWSWNRLDGPDVRGCSIDVEPQRSHRRPRSVFPVGSGRNPKFAWHLPGTQVSNDSLMSHRQCLVARCSRAVR